MHHRKMDARRGQRAGPPATRVIAVGVAITCFVLTILALLRVHVYFARDEAQYLNPIYSEGTNLRSVQVHVALGTITFFVAALLLVLGAVPAMRAAAEAFPCLMTARLAAAVLYAGFALATVGTAPANISDLANIAGSGIVAIAGVWAVAWIGATMKLCATLQPVELFAEHWYYFRLSVLAVHS